jgi:hypothetical protein
MREWRCPEAGLAHLEWESGLRYNDEMGTGQDLPEYGQPLPHALAAVEQRRLYDWWKTIRPTRPDPHNASGWSAICDRRHASGQSFWTSMSDHTDEERAESHAALERCHEIEQRYEDEDEAMLIALVKIRESLRT